MTVRERWEQEEDRFLSPYGVRSAQSRGRERPVEPCPLRTDFQRDRDRIIHCKSFRRLKYKTQCFLSPEGDHFRTRMTHTLEVAQVARTLARALRLNEDLAEAIALGHDLGHTPFGHMGERTLNRLTPGGFAHMEQSLRMVEILEQDGAGLNLTWEVRDGIAHHSGTVVPQTLEGWCVRRADRIAYINHDIDDALRAGMVQPEDFPRDCVQMLGHTHGERMDTMIQDVVRESADQPYVRMSAPIAEASDALRTFLFARVYQSEWAQREEQKADTLMEGLYGYYLQHPAAMPLEYIQRGYMDGMQRAVCDYIACMTDRYAVRLYQQFFIPDAFASKV
ncbi:MAG: deoxyguanosinetriphosphate triphosphohydrolase [Clostridia bacterium]